jgi:hypothetical protein
MAGEGFNTLSNIIVRLEIAKFVWITLLMTNVCFPLKDKEILFVTITSFIKSIFIVGRAELLSTNYEGNIILILEPLGTNWVSHGVACNVIS